MNKDDISEALKKSNFSIVNEKRNGNDTGWMLKIDNGCILQLYDSGKIVFQGKNADSVKDALKITSVTQKGSSGYKLAPPPSRKVFVVYGHDDAARTELEAILRRWNLEPLILDQLPSGGQTIIEKLESVRKDAVFAVVIATPDDEGNKRGEQKNRLHRARQNVVLELGMMLAVLGRPRVAILLKSDLQMEKPSDIQGLIYIPFKENVTEAKLTLAKEMNSQGIRIDLDRV